MKIVFIGGRDINLLGGIENYMLNLSSQLVKMGHTPIVFCESDHNAEKYINGFRVIYLKGLKSPFLCKPYVGLKATFIATFKLKNVDLIHYNAWPPSLWNFIARIRGIPSLMQGHGLEWQRSKYSPFQRKIMKFMEWVTAHLNRNLIMCSEEQTQYFKKYYNREAETIPTAINLPSDKKENLDENVFKHLEISPNKYFLFLARLVKDKNPHYLISAFRKINNRGYKLVIAGDNPADRMFVNELRDLAGDNSDIVFTGAIYGEEKDVLLRNAFAFCLPSTIEGLSIALLEAMSYKLPIIASNIQANKEVLDKNSALWIKPEDIISLKDALEYAVNNPEVLKNMVKLNYSKVKNKYTWDKVAIKYLKHVEKIINGQFPSKGITKSL